MYWALWAGSRHSERSRSPRIESKCLRFLVTSATLVVLGVSLRDIHRHGTLRRVPFYVVLFALALARFVVSSIPLGFR